MVCGRWLYSPPIFRYSLSRCSFTRMRSPSGPANLTLTLRSRASNGAPETLKTSLVTFINVLHAAGPGSVKFIRFVFQSLDDCGSFVHAGPLVRLPPFVAPRTRDNSRGLAPQMPRLEIQVLESKRSSKRIVTITMLPRALSCEQEVYRAVYVASLLMSLGGKDCCSCSQWTTSLVVS